MKADIDLQKIHISINKNDIPKELRKTHPRHTGVYYKEYNNMLNFPDGKRLCKECASSMERIPIGQCFVRVPGGKILVNVNTSNGMLFVSNSEPDYMWGCKNCVNGIVKTKTVTM